MQFGRVGPPFWNDKRVFLIGGGPSLCGIDLARFSSLEGHAILGVNQAMFDVPYCDAGVSMDWKFVRNNQARLAAFATRAELYLAVGNEPRDDVPLVPGAVYLHNADGAGLSFNPEIVYRGGTSGYAALNVAVLKHAKVIILFGYDYSLIDGKHHYHDAYPWVHVANNQSFDKWSKHYTHAAIPLRQAGIMVINASMESAIDVFPKCSIDGALSTSVQRSSFMGCMGSATTYMSAQ